MNTAPQTFTESSGKPPLVLLIAAPRGFCAGGDRALRGLGRAVHPGGEAARRGGQQDKRRRARGRASKGHL